MKIINFEILLLLLCDLVIENLINQFEMLYLHQWCNLS
jgi:hypothetical protein